MKCKLITLALLVLSANVFAAEATGTISWTAPTAFVDGSPLNPATDIIGYTIHAGDSPRNYNLETIEVGPNGSSADVSIDVPGNFQDGDEINLYIAMTATDTTGDVSAYSNEVYKSFLVSITDRVPNPPSNVQITLPITIECFATSAGVSCSVTPTN